MMKKIISLIIFALSLGVFTSSAHASPESVLKEIASSKRPAADLTIQYEAGREYFGGKSLLTISGNGDITLSYNDRGKKQQFKDKLTDKAFMMIVETMLKDKIWQTPKATPPFPADAAIVKISLKTAQGDLDYTQQALETQALMGKHLHTTVKIMQALIKEVSKGKIKY